MKTRVDLSSLNDQQRKAVLTENKRVLVLAGAGSGKTKTLLQKITYLIEDLEVRSANILAITFTRNAANEMIDRLIMTADKTGEYGKIINDNSRTPEEVNKLRRYYTKRYAWVSNLTVKTFHSLCLQILKNDGVKVYDNRFKILKDDRKSESVGRITAPESVDEVIQRAIISYCENRINLLRLKRYILDFYVDKIESDGIDDSEFRPEGKIYTTLAGDKVRSKSERFIADWLYRHNIEYQYEPKLEVDFEFRPDFYIPQANLYIEHVSNLSKGMLEKEVQFEKAGKTFVKTHEQMARDSAIFIRALDRIIKGRLPSEYLTKTALSYEEEFSRYHKEIKRFVSDLKSALSKIKAENLEFKSVTKDGIKSKHNRVSQFYKIGGEIFRLYQEYCVSRSYIDFDDMILLCLRLLQENPEVRKKYQTLFKYILVDEFQDVNSSQVDLLKSLISQDAQLFCVGDDWQSIYGFRGSEVRYILNFENHFEHSEVIKLNINYRSNDSIVTASNELIKHNKHQIGKDITAARKSPTKIEFFRALDTNEQAEFIADEVERLRSEGLDKEDILILYRRTSMLRELSDIWKETGRKTDCAKKTIHASKGLEASAVFIIGLTQGYGGFPDVWMSDKIFQVIKESDHEALLEEERRLFYVAVTRAKDKLYLITDKGNESQFLDEIPKQLFHASSEPIESIQFEIKTCEKCESAIESDFRYCPYCGASLEISDVSKEQIILNENAITGALQEIPFTPGRTWLSKYLTGSNEEDVNKKNIKGEYFGYFQDAKRKQVMAAIDSLIEQEKIKKYKKGYRDVLSMP